MQFEVETDHKPLVAIYSTKNLNDLTPRLQRMRMRAMQFCFQVRYTPDTYSSYPELANLEDLSSRCVINHLKSIFARHGIAEVFRIDNGPQFASAEFRNFTRDWNLKHITSSPRYPQSRSMVKTKIRSIHCSYGIQSYSISRWTLAGAASDGTTN